MATDPLRRSRFRLPWRTADRIARDLDDELRFHVDMRIAELVAGGASEDAARRLALSEFGDLASLRRDCTAEDARAERGTRWRLWLDDLLTDLAHAAMRANGDA